MSWFPGVRNKLSWIGTDVASEQPMGDVTRLDYGLSPSLPVCAGSTVWEKPTPLAVDVHEGFEVGVVLSGAQERHFEGSVYVAQPGDLWLCATWEPHGWRVLAPRTHDLVVVFLPAYLGQEQLGNASWLSLFAAPPDQRPRARDAPTRGRLLATARDMLEEVRTQNPGWDTTGLRLGLLRLLFLLSREWRHPAATATGGTEPSSLARVIPAVELAHASPSRRVSLAEAARACRLSRARFSALFTATMGLSFGRFCLRARLALVADRLLNSEAPIDAIAREVGFCDATHLRRAFLRHYGCTPSSYRAQWVVRQPSRPLSLEPVPHQRGRPAAPRAARRP